MIADGNLPRRPNLLMPMPVLTGMATKTAKTSNKDGLVRATIYIIYEDIAKSTHHGHQSQCDDHQRRPVRQLSLAHPISQ